MTVERTCKFANASSQTVSVVETCESTHDSAKSSNRVFVWFSDNQYKYLELNKRLLENGLQRVQRFFA